MTSKKEKTEFEDNLITANKFGADKSRLYLINYEAYFSPYRDLPINLLELGVDKGGSLLLWKNYFSKGTIVGLDLNPCTIEDPSGRIHFHQGSQDDRDLLDTIREVSAPSGFDIIIDDASHRGQPTRTSFWHLFENHLKAGGLYVIEDWRTGYWGSWADGAAYKKVAPKPNPINKICASLVSVLEQTRITNRILGRIKNMSPKKRFSSHQYGLVGVIKQLIDELGMDAIKIDELGESALTEIQAKNSFPPRFPKFREMKITPSQVFIIKSEDSDDVYIAEMIHHFFRHHHP